MLVLVMLVAVLMVLVLVLVSVLVLLMLVVVSVMVLVMMLVLLACLYSPFLSSSFFHFTTVNTVSGQTIVDFFPCLLFCAVLSRNICTVYV